MAGAVVITGTSTGIGEACALRLDKLGFRVFAGVRKVEDGATLARKASGRLTPLLLDITSEASIAAAAARVAEAVGETGLAGLVNNAGIAVGGPLEFLPIAELRRQLEVNVIGQIAVTQAFLPLLRMGEGRIVNIGSISGRMAIPMLGPYCASKFALEALTAALRMELTPWGIAVSIIEPGGVATPIWRKSLAAGQEMARRLPPQAEQFYGPLIARQQKLALRSDRNGLPPDRVARDVVHALTAPKPKTRYMMGRSTAIGEVLIRLPERVRERLILRRLKIKSP